MTIPDSASDEASTGTAATLSALLRELSKATDPYQVRELWSKALDVADRVEDRERVLVEAAKRLPALKVPSRGGRSGTDRLWLRHAAHEVLSAGGAVGNELAAAAQKVLREAVFTAELDLEQWRASQKAGMSLLDFMRNSPRSAATLRELARLTHQLRAIGATTLLDRQAVRDLTAFHQAVRGLPATASAPVGEWLRVTSHDLRNWANSPDANHQLPILIRRLVIETGDQVTTAHFPAGTAVTSAGWDGIVEAEGSSLFVPKGRSGWELSTHKSAQAKAKSDFQTRVSLVPEAERQSMTFVEVIARPWTNVQDFRTEAIAAKAFQEVRAFNVEDLTAWLELAPSTSVWFKELLGAPVTGVRSVETVWDAWLNSTTTPLDERVVLGGREDTAADVASRAAVGPGVTTVGGDVRLEEIVAFFGAAAQGAEPNDNQLARLVVVDEATAAERLLRMTAPMVLLLTAPDFASKLPPSSKHHVFIAVPGGERVDVTIPRVGSEAVSDYFRSLGVDFHVASERGELARRSLLALRRHLATQPEIHRPSWARPPVPPEVRRVLLLQAWNRELPADRSAVERLLLTDYGVVEERLRELTASPEDPFVALFDDDWHVVSTTDSWLLLASQVASSDLDDFAGLAVEVLTDVDPILALSEEERWRASIDGVARSYSPRLRRGIARTVGLLGAIGSSAELGGRSAEITAREVVHRVLTVANADSSFALWGSVSPYLSLLCEAAPAVAIETIRAGLASAPPLMVKMFRDQEDSVLGPRSSPHIQFLWALETLAWSATYVGDAVDLLAELAEIDPGGKWSNRPIASIQSILCPWHPSTSAGPEQQVRIVERLRRDHPTIAWNVLLSLLPNSHASTVLHRGPEIRDWKQGEPTVLSTDYWTIVDAAARALLAEAGASVQRWAKIVEEFDKLPPGVRPLVTSQLTGLSPRINDEGDRRTIWEAVRDFVAKHREYADAKWALPEDELAVLDPLLSVYEPADPRLRYRWLFDGGMIQLGDLRRRDDFAAYDAELDRRRTHAVGDIFVSAGLEGVVDFARTAAVPGQVGAALARHSADDSVEPQLLAHLASDDSAASSLAFAYFGERFRQRGWGYVDSLCDAAAPLRTARLLRVAFEPLRAAERADKLGPAVAKEFWREFTYFGLGNEFEGAVELARRLQAAGRHAASLNLLALYSHNADSLEFAEAIADGLEGLMLNPDGDPDIAALREYDFDLLLKAVSRYREELGVARVIRIEWFFLPALGFDPDAPNLHRALAEDPKLFVEMIRYMYKPVSKIDENVPELDADRRAAENAFRLLHSWRVAPGTNASGEMDAEALRAWVGTARELLAAADRALVGDDEIGSALVAAPSDETGWPPRAVKDLIEELRSDALERGFARRMFNNRGVTSRSLDAGGTQEWALAANHRSSAEAIRTEWPRVARIFDSLADSYERDARREDAEAERRRRGLD